MHPIALGAIALLIANDHFLKAAYPGLVTGKLSDFAGLIFFPLLLQAAAEIAMPQRLMGSRAVLLGSLFVTGLVFVAVKASPVGAETFGALLGAGQWIVGGGAGRPLPVSIVADATDLVALISLPIAYAIGRRRT